jgi:phosphohistidine phosphatase
VVVRHAKSAWPSGVPDRSRPLGPRGVGDAPRMGRLLRQRVGSPDIAVISPAVRAQQTWELLAEQLPGEPELRVDDRVYDEWGALMIDVVRELPARAQTALIVGHEPGVSRLVLQLADRSNPQDRERIRVKFPTCAVAVLGADGPWSAFEPGAAGLEWFRTPRD